ncbi:MAG TPA: CsbD family protein [Geminicoccaceae bacterium]|nr:CsbD family protein [Geminicoccaceae bacterium]
MNWEQVKGNWNQMQGRIKQKWGDLTDDDLTRIEGRRDELIGRLQERYGIAKEEAERQVGAWEREL